MTSTDPDLWKHQVEALAFCRERWASGQRGVLLGIPMGGGKTRTALEAMQWLMPPKTLIVAPLSVIPSWKREIREYASEPVSRVHDIPQGSSYPGAANSKMPSVYLVNPEKVWRSEPGNALLKAPPDLLIVDECHKAKAPNGKLSRYLQRLADKVPHVLGLTGTPMPHNHTDLYAQARFLEPRIYGTSFNRFKNNYCVMGGYQGREVIGIRNEERFVSRKNALVFYREKRDILANLPEETSGERAYDLKDAAEPFYSLAHQFWAGVELGEITPSNALVKLLRLQQVSTGLAKLDDGSEVPITTGLPDQLREIIEQLKNEHSLPLVVFVRFVHEARIVEQLCDELTLVCHEVSGRRKELRDGRMRHDTDVLVVQIQAGGVGIDLSRASTSVFTSIPLSLADYEQAKARLHRPGQKNPVHHIHMVGTQLAARILQGLRDKKSALDVLLRRK